MRPQMAIISENTLAAMALRGLLSDIVPSLDIDIVCYHSLEECLKAADGMVAHYFVSASIVFHNPEYFCPLTRRTIVLTDGDATPFTQSGFRSIDITATEQQIVRSILQIHQAGHPAGHAHHHCVEHPTNVSSKTAMQPVLSQREKEVLSLMVKGMINKEIADKLNISTATVIFHRNNICEKLNTRSIGRLTVYAVINNIVTLSEI